MAVIERDAGAEGGGRSVDDAPGAARPAPVPVVDGPAIEAESSAERTRSSTPKRKRKRRG